MESIKKEQSTEIGENMNYGYYSKLLNKPFDSLEDLKEAEKVELDARAEKEQKALAKKTEANKVEEAYKAYSAATKVCNTEISEAKKVCAKLIADAKAAYSATVDAAQEKVIAAENAYNEALQEFLDKHPEGFHMTFKDGDTVTTISHNVYHDIFNDFYDSFIKLFS